jgi:hypothetical protein
VHRDVSPPNIMVTADGTVKVLDFGIAKARGANSRTRTGTVKGKNAYMSPEQILGKPLDRRSDIFALGVVMYEMLAIRRLFHRDSDFLTFKAITEEPIPEIRERRPDIPPGMRAALLQAMARDPNGRFETAQAFGQAIKQSVATLGGPAATAELARLLFTDFGDEMASRDEILKAADDPNAAPISIGPSKPASPPPIPKRPDPPAARSGEMSQATPKPRPPTGQIEAIPSVMLGTPASTRIQLPDLENVLDLSSNVGADSWMADGGTDLLSAHRWKSLRNFAIAIGVLTVAAVGVFFVVTKMGGHEQRVVAPPPPADAAVVKVVPPPVDAGDEINHDDIVALSKFGFFSITATAKTTIYVDDKYIGETPLTRLPLKPGPHTVKAVGPRGKSKVMKVTIVGGRDDDEGTITW